MSERDLPLVSVLFATYNRPHTLVAAYETFLITTDYPRERLQLVVTDDGSDDEVQALIRTLDFDDYCFAPRNQGLGANLNKGLRACRGDFTLLLQDDWVCMRHPDYLRSAVAALRAFDDIGLVLLHDWGDCLAAETRRVDGATFRILAARSPDGREAKRLYTDNPHVKRRDFHDVVGWYAEGTPMTVMEHRMTAAVAAQTRFKSALLEGDDAFVHIGARYSFNPGKRLARLERLLSAVPFGDAALRQWRRLRRALRQWTGREGT